jgi:uncharacterized membrane protein YbhN (UPF0104 family)
MTEYVVRFLLGGAVVSAFAMLGDVLRPKSFAGLFGAAPSVALATLGIAIYQHGAGYAALQSQSMIAGAIALAVTASSSAILLFGRGSGPCQPQCCPSPPGWSLPSAC